MATQTPNVADAKGAGYAPSPAEDGNAPELKRVFSATKWIGLVNEVLALIQTGSVSIYNPTGTDLPAGPLAITGYWTGDGYLMNGSFAQGLGTISIDTGTEPIAIGSLFTIDGIDQTFTATTALTGAGSISFTPVLPAGVGDNVPLTINAGYTVGLAIEQEATIIATSDILAHTRASSKNFGRFTSSLDTSGAAVDDPVYLDRATGNLTLTEPTFDKFTQTVGYVATVTNPGDINGICKPPKIKYDTVQASAIASSNSTLDGVIDAVQFATVDYDSSSVFNLGTFPNRATIPATGLYSIVISCQWDNAPAGMRQIFMAVNGGAVIGGNFGLGDTNELGYQSASAIAQLSATDYVEFYFKQTTGSDIDLNNVRIALSRIG